MLRVVSAGWRFHTYLSYRSGPCLGWRGRTARCQYTWLPQRGRAVNNGNNGDGPLGILVLDAEWRLNRDILRRWETTATVRAPVRDCPDTQRLPIRIRPGDRPPVQKF